MNIDYEKNGYLVIKGFLKECELRQIREVVTQFHDAWKLKNAQYYAERAINSAYLTATEHLKNSDRELLFKFIGSAKLMNVVASIIGKRPAFMNTQLFFDPVNEGQRNYWHRDTQYHMTIDEQKQALLGPKVVHFRIPLVDEPGVELVPGTHKRWDKDDELNVRLERNGRQNHEDLMTGKTVTLNAGDLLIFSANMLHRGVYGMNRLSLDILFCDPALELMKFIDDCCLPDKDMLARIENATAFKNSIKMKAKNKVMHPPP